LENAKIVSVRVEPSPWVRAGRFRRPAAELRLFCFPYVGGGATAYQGWHAELPEWVDLCAVQLPGRENRFAEPRFRRLEPMIEALAGGLSPELDRPYALYGHSFGALVAYHFAVEVGRRGLRPPSHLLVSGSEAPQRLDWQASFHELPSAELSAELRKWGGTPDEVLGSPDLMTLVEPIIRADLEILVEYRHTPVPRLSCPISAFMGADDPIERDDVSAWRELTEARFVFEIHPGDHFFIHRSRDLFLASLRGALEPHRGELA